MAQEDEELYNLVKSKSTETKLNLSKCNLRSFPPAYPLTLKQVHLKGNKLTQIPSSIFTDLPNLVWLDVRDNELTELPPQIQCANSLKDLLLGGNFLLQLPACLASLPNLTGLQIQPNPALKSPPKDIVEQGIQEIMKYLSKSVDLTIPTAIDQFEDTEIENYWAPNSTQNRILQLSLKKPISLNEYKDAMDKHLSEERVPIHLKKWDSMSEEDKVDRTIKNAAIQHELQRTNDAIERQNFRHRGRTGLAGAEPMGDSHEIELVLNHAKNLEDLTLGNGNPAHGTLTTNQSTLYDNRQKEANT